MSIKLRRILLLLFTVLFTLSSLVAILYTTGYRYNWTLKKLQKTSSLTLNTVPTQAEVYLNGKNLDKTTPLRLTNLLPNEYLMEIKKTGFQSWSKKLLLEPNKATLAENIILFKEQPQPEIIYQTTQLQNLIPYNNQNSVLLILTTQPTEAQILTLQLDTLTSKELLTSDAILKFESWNPGQDRFLYHDSQGYKIFNLLTGQTEINLSQYLQPLQILKTKWQTNYQLLVKTNGGLYLFSLLDKKKQLLTDKVVLDFLADQNNFYYLTQVQSLTKLWRQPLNQEQPDGQIQLPTSLNYQLIDIKDQLLTLINNQDQYLYLLTTEDDGFQLKQTLNQAAQAQWSREKKYPRLLYYNQNEIYIYDYSYNQKEYYQKILARYSQTINQVSWHPACYHLLYQLDKQIKAIELDERDHYNIFDLYQSPIKPKTFFTNAQGNLLYLWITDGDQDQILKLSITESSGWFFLD